MTDVHIHSSQRRNVHKSIFLLMLLKGRLETQVGDVVWATPLDTINLHVRGGHILPTQKEALNTMLRLVTVELLNKKL